MLNQSDQRISRHPVHKKNREKKYDPCFADPRMKAHPPYASALIKLK